MGALATASAFAALLAACTVGPDYVAPETAADPAPTTAQESVA